MSKSDYKSTLNLPKTAFPMKANLPHREPNILKHWEKFNLYETVLKHAQNRPTFILNDGPPYANGAIHIGHALNKILKDIVVKSKIMSGYRTPSVPGWDCHGLPIELKVEKKVGKAGDKLDAKSFRQKCREYANSQIELQKKAFIRLGVIGDWEHPYKTMDFAYEANIVRALAVLLEKGHVVRGDKPVHWCLDCHSALAEAEVEYKDKQSFAIDVLFPIEQTSLIKAPFSEGEGPVFAVIWTTTPWTLPANEAVAASPDQRYASVQIEWNGKPIRLIIAEQLVSDFCVRCGFERYSVLETFDGSALENLKLNHPFYDKQVPIVLGDHVTMETGSGLVHTAPAHGLEDHRIGLEYDLPKECLVGADGCFIKGTPLFEGQFVLGANQSVVDILKEKGHLLHETKLDHSYPHCWRHKTPLIFRATPQWFISMQAANLQKDAINEIKKVSWHPAWGEERFEKMIADRPDWCISRQRTWGVPIPFLLHKDTGQIHPNMVKILATVADRIEKSGIEAWHDLKIADLIPQGEAQHYLKSQDTLDVWFDSGVEHYCVLDQRPELHNPADLYLEGSDQHRGWFQSSMLTSVGMKGAAPYKEVITHGFTVDGQGKKMSKSLGNVVDPDKVIQTLGADVLRLWVTSADYHREMNVSDEILKRMSDAYRRIRNTMRFLLSNLHEFDPKKHLVPLEDMVALDHYIVAKAQALQEDLIDAYNAYEFHLIYQKIHNFCVVDLGNFYLDIIKDRQYTAMRDGQPRRSCQSALYHLAEYIVRWLAPILTFTAEEIWQYLPGERDESVYLSQWYRPTLHFDEHEYDFVFWQTVRLVREEVNKSLELAREESQIGSGLETHITLYVDETLKSILSKLHDELHFVLITSGVTLDALENAPSTLPDSGIKGLKVSVGALTYDKCERCWHRVEDVNSDQNYPGICNRCVENIAGTGETRLYA